MRRVTALAALLTALAIPAHASAHPTVSQALQIAYAADPQAPCAGYVSIRWDPTLASRGIDGESTGRYFSGDAPEAIRGCIIALDPGLHADPDRQCDVIVHEVKHLAGYGHTLTGIMQPTVGEWPACHPRLTKRQQARKGITSMLPRRYTWWITCNRKLTVCRAQANGAKTRRYSIQADGGVDPIG